MMRNLSWPGLLIVIAEDFELGLLLKFLSWPVRRDRKNSHPVKQSETVHILSHPDGLRIQKKARHG